MENQERQYIKNSIYFNLQIKEIHDLMSEKISKNIYKLKLINRDIIDGYLNKNLNDKIMSFLNKKASEFNDDDVNNIINNIINDKQYMKDKESCEIKELTPLFLFPEEMKINSLEIPNNFYVITEERFNKIFENCNNLTDFKTYSAILGTDGIFMWIEGDMITNDNEEQAKEYKKLMYFIENNNDLKINKIFLLKNEEELEKELNSIVQEEKKNYFEKRTIIKNDLGSYNMIYDGKIIGKYINIIKNNEASNTLQESVNETNGDDRIKKEISLIEEKEGLIDTFLPYLLICLSKIQKLKKGLEQKNKGLLKYLLDIINNLDNKNYKETCNCIINFENEFVKKELTHKFSYPIDNKNEAFKNLIEMLLKEFHQEIYVEDKPRETFEELKHSTFIFDLFFGLKKINKKEEHFTTIELNPASSGNQNITIDDLLIHYKFKHDELVLFFPNVLILLIIDIKGLLKLPLEINLKFDNKDNNIYKLRSCIQMDENFLSFIKNDETQDFSKVSFEVDDKDKKKLKFEKSNIDEINKKFSKSYNICFYEIDVEDINNNVDNKETSIENNCNGNFNN